MSSVSSPTILSALQASNAAAKEKIKDEFCAVTAFAIGLMEQAASAPQVEEDTSSDSFVDGAVKFIAKEFGDDVKISAKAVALAKSFLNTVEYDSELDRFEDSFEALDYLMSSKALPFIKEQLKANNQSFLGSLSICWERSFFFNSLLNLFDFPFTLRGQTRRRE